MKPLRILIVGGKPEAAEDIERVLRRDLPRGTCIVPVAGLPRRVEGFDAAVVVAEAGRDLPSEVPGLPTVVVGPRACLQDRADLARRGVHHGISVECATCERQPDLAASLSWVIERAGLVRELELACQREQHTALHDPLTGLPNLRLYRERLGQLLAQGRRTGKRFALLFVDLDRFKEVNDSVGHAAGDRLLQQVADRIKACIRETDTVARRGGDEFVVLLDDVGRAKDVVHVAGKILHRIARSTVVLGTVVRPSASIGIAIFPDDGSSDEVLERRADRAMYRAKQLGGQAVLRAEPHRARKAAIQAAGPPRTPPPAVSETARRRHRGASDRARRRRR
jgi:diguanylate cyclase (GGDEF)-like protein